MGLLHRSEKKKDFHLVTKSCKNVRQSDWISILTFIWHSSSFSLLTSSIQIKSSGNEPAKLAVELQPSVDNGGVFNFFM